MSSKDVLIWEKYELEAKVAMLTKQNNVMTETLNKVGNERNYGLINECFVTCENIKSEYDAENEDEDEDEKDGV